jgi:hypothetical protein
MAYKLGYMDLFALAVERMSWAASQADDPLLVPVAAIRRSSAFLATGHGTEACACSTAPRARQKTTSPIARAR